ncbi:ESX secretion-associated protein EspG [Actinokineospora iranica]|uniref:EspG family protein n=1 Tax=Actinokineospora iranica TaxID=1271860 RepID=A0A1G6UWD7_9PSEU|nr:ESX secretion-associated protein EspG [Actinokineospora iranica]SDD44905.1 EspG family protein [Actinokineospora iranica]
MTLNRPVVLSASGLARVVRDESIGRLPLVLEPAARWRPDAEERAAGAAARAEIARVGGVDRRGRLDADLAATFTVLCRPAVEFYGWYRAGDREVAALVAAIGRDAVLAVRDRDTVTLAQVDPDRLPDVLAAQTPDTPPARGQAVTVVADEMRAAAAGQRHTAAGVGIRQVGADIRLAQRITALPVTGGGQLYVAVRDGGGRRSAVRQPLRVADTVQGRWLNYTPPNDGSRVVFAPGDRPAVVGRLREMWRALTR